MSKQDVQRSGLDVDQGTQKCAQLDTDIPNRKSNYVLQPESWQGSGIAEAIIGGYAWDFMLIFISLLLLRRATMGPSRRVNRLPSGKLHARSTGSHVKDGYWIEVGLIVVKGTNSQGTKVHEVIQSRR